MQDRILNRSGVVVFTACVLVSFAAVACAQNPSRKPRNAKPSERGFRLVTLIDLVYLPKLGEPSGNATHNKRHGKSGLGGSLIVHEDEETHLFRVLLDGKGPKDGFFQIAGKPVAPVWKSSDPSVVRITLSARGMPSFKIRGPGKATVTVSVGDWSGRADMEAVDSPFPTGTSRHDLLKQYGYPAKKYRCESDSPHIPAGFEKLPRGCCAVYLKENYDDASGYSFAVQAGPSPRYGSYVGPNYATDGEFWEYPNWPRCLIFVMGGSTHAPGVAGIVTRPAQKGDAARIAEPATAKQPTEPTEPKANVPGNQVSVPTGWVRIVNRVTGLAIGPRKGNPASGTMIDQREGRFVGQCWQIEASQGPQSRGFYTIRNRKTSQYLAIEDRSAGQGASACQMPADHNPAMFWQFDDVGKGYWRITNKDSGQCLEAPGNDQGTIIRQNQRDNGVMQEWRLEPVGVP
jgi:hypothetical protein